MMIRSSIKIHWVKDRLMTHTQLCWWGAQDQTPLHGQQMFHLHTSKNALKPTWPWKSTKECQMCGHGFVGGLGFCGSESTNDEQMQKLTAVDGSQAYLLATDHYSNHIWGISAVSKSPPLTCINRLLTRISPNVQVKYFTMNLGG